MGIGRDLRDARLARNISLEEVHRRTRIAPKYLEALEEDRFDVFPSPAYTRGFLRAYAKVVGMNPVLVIRQYNEEVREEPPPIVPQTDRVDRELFSFRRFFERAASGTRALRVSLEEEAVPGESFGDPAPEHQTEVRVRRDPVLARHRNRGLKAVLLLVALGAGVALIARSVPLLKDAWKRVTSGAGGPLRSTASLGGDETLRSAVSSRGDGREGAFGVPDGFQHLVLKGLDLSWVLVTMDGQSTSEVILDPGEVKTYKAREKFTVRLGNAGGVDLQFNGRSLGVLGPVGQVIEISLPRTEPAS